MPKVSGQYFSGRVHSVVFENEARAFYILKVVLDGGESASLSGHGTVVVRGEVPGIRMESGAWFGWEGVWEDHATYGRQLKITRAPVFGGTWNAETCARILSAQRIGPALVQKIKETFGEEMATACTDVERLKTVPGFTPIVAQHVADKWCAARASFLTLEFLNDLNLPQGRVRQVWSTFGDRATEVLSTDPWALVQVEGITFTDADTVAERLGLKTESNNPLRVRGAVLYAARMGKGFGHLYVSSGEILSVVRRCDPCMTERDIALALKDLSDTGLVVMDRRTVAGLTAVYDPWSYTIETESAARLRERMVAARPTPEMQARYVATLYGEPRDEPLRAAVLAALERIGTAGGVSLTPLQTESVVNALCEPVSVITGLPGSGKTTCLRMVVLLLQEAGVPFLLLAPTGIAAKRVASVTGSPAFTIHRAFAAKGMETSTREATYAGVVGASEDVGGIGDGSDEQWGYSGDRPHPAEVVIIDESSMVDQHVLYRTLQCTRSDARLVFVGDAAQLPSVGPGNVLRDLIAWRVCATVALTEIFRQASASPIIRAAHDVHRGVVPQAPQETDFSLIPLADERDIQKKILSVAQQLYEARENFQVLSPRHAGLVGVTDLNTRLREQLNPKQASLREVSFGAEVLREDDRVMVVRNDYKLGLFNGDLGKVTRIDKKSKEIEIKIHGPPPLVVKVPFKNAATLLRLAYAVTVHKCVHPDTLVETSEGLLPLRSISDTGIVGTPRGPRPYHTKVENPPARMLRITTEKGYQICSTPDHGVDVWRGGAFVRVEANEIREGDHLRLSLGVKCDPENPPPLPPVPLPGDIREKVFRIPSEMSLELAEFLGLMVAGGSLSREGFSFFKRHLDVVERFSSLSETLFGFAAPVVEELNGWRVEGGSTDVARWLSAVGGLNPHQKAVPECVARSPERYQRAFLRGVFEDGTVNVRNGAAGPRLDPMEWVTAYESLARYVHRMLLRAEIPSVLRRTKGGSNWVLYVYGAHAARFGREVGFISKFKQERLSYASGAPVNDYVPVTVDEARALVAHYRKTTFPYNVRSRLRVSLAMLERLETSEITPLTKTLRARAAAYTVRVVRVDSEVAPSMCVTVPDGHQFIQGGFYGWNCQGLEHDVIVMPMTLSFGFQLQRNLFYTAITRARRRVVLVGTRGAMERAVTNARENERNTLFLHRLRDSEDAAK